MNGLPAGPWVVTPDAKLPFDLRVHTEQGLALAKVYGADALPRPQLAKAIAAIPAMIAALTEQAEQGSEIAADALWAATGPDFSQSEHQLIEWLSKAEHSAYGECKGRDLDRMIDLGLAKIITKDQRGDDYNRVQLTDKGEEAARHIGPW